MGCVDENELLDFLSGTLAADATHKVEAHIDGCDTCRQVVATLARIHVDNPSVAVRAESSAPVTELGEFATLLVPGTKIARYIVLRSIGSGGMGVVYAAHDPELDRRVAIKLLHRDRGFEEGAVSQSDVSLREAQALARLSHPNVVGVHDVGTAHGRVFIAMELVEGRTLKAWLRAEPRSHRQIRHVFFLAGQGLAAAHAAGLVHRDFKPDNVIVGDDGRVRVLDFGFAHLALQHEEVVTRMGEASSLAMSGAMSVSGVLAGTPAYMAPEHRAGRTTDARSDQYSFCVALWEALHGTRPSAKTLGESRRIPASLHKLLLRGLSPDPDKRFASMSDLLVELSLEREARRRSLWIGAAAGVVLGLVGLGAYDVSSSRAAMCSGASRKLDGIWDASRKAQMRSRFLSLGRPYAEDALRGVSESLDHFAQAWVSMHTEACEATRVRGEQSEQLLGERMSCLATRLEGLRATTEALVNADVAVLDRAATIAGAMPRIDTCADAAWLHKVEPRPIDPVAAQAVERLSAKVGEVRVLHRAGKYAEGLAMLVPLMDDIRAVRYAPLEAEALRMQGELHVELGDLQKAEHELFDAIVAAERGGDTEVLFLSAYGLAWVTRLQGRFDDAMRWLDLGQASLAHLNDPTLEIKLLSVRETVLSDQGRFDDARQIGEHALEMAVRVLGPEHREVSSPLLNLGIIAHDQGRNEEALGYYVRAHDVAVKTYGAKHPYVTLPMVNIGSTLYDLKDWKQARDWLNRALVLRHDELGIEDRQVALIHLNLGLLDRTEGHLASALRHQLESLRIYKSTLGDNHPLLGFPMSELGRIYLAMGEPERSIEVLEQAMQLPPRKLANKPELKFPLGCALWESGRDRARGLRLIAEVEDGYTDNNSLYAMLHEDIRAWRARHPRAR